MLYNVYTKDIPVSINIMTTIKVQPYRVETWKPVAVNQVATKDVFNASVRRLNRELKAM